MFIVHRKKQLVKPHYEVWLAADVVIKFKGGDRMRKQRRKRERGVIQGFSPGSRGRFFQTAFNSLANWKAVIHLTYPGNPDLVPTDGKVVKTQLNAFLTRLRATLSGPVHYLWMLEFQERGAPHFMILVDQRVEKHWLSETWNRIAGQQDPDHLAAGTKVEGFRESGRAIGYMAKRAGEYMAKLDQKQVPEGFENVGRYWGSSRGLVQWEKLDLDLKTGDQVARVLRKPLEKRLHHRASWLRKRRAGLKIYGGGTMGKRLVGYLTGGQTVQP